jgi:hypothetical protein
MIRRRFDLACEARPLLRLPPKRRRGSESIGLLNCAVSINGFPGAFVGVPDAAAVSPVPPCPTTPLPVIALLCSSSLLKLKNHPIVVDFGDPSELGLSALCNSREQDESFGSFQKSLRPCFCLGCESLNDFGCPTEYRDVLRTNGVSWAPGDA